MKLGTTLDFMLRKWVWHLLCVCRTRHCHSNNFLLQKPCGTIFISQFFCSVHVNETWYKRWLWACTTVYVDVHKTLLLCVGWTECTFAPATIAPMINTNIKHNPNPNPNLNLNLYPTPNPIITLTLTLCCRRCHRRSKCRITGWTRCPVVTYKAVRRGINHIQWYFLFCVHPSHNSMMATLLRIGLLIAGARYIQQILIFTF